MTSQCLFFKQIFAAWHWYRLGYEPVIPGCVCICNWYWFTSGQKIMSQKNPKNSAWLWYLVSVSGFWSEHKMTKNLSFFLTWKLHGLGTAHDIPVIPGICFWYWFTSEQKITSKKAPKNSEWLWYQKLKLFSYLITKCLGYCPRYTCDTWHLFLVLVYVRAENYEQKNHEKIF